MDKKLHDANRKRWDAASERWANNADSRGLWRRCSSEPELVLSPRELEYLGDVSGKRVAVLGSGDNQVVFALAGLGAEVTSVDISQNQLDVARRRADELDLSVSFVRADVTDLSKLDSAAFDVVYTGGHVAVWVSDIDIYYSEASRILRSGGIFIVAEYHPFRRLWKESRDELVVEHPYFEGGPFEYNLTEEILCPKAGDMKSYEFHWTVSDHINAVLKSGCDLLEADEFGTHVGDWEGAPMHGLPEFLLLVARKIVESKSNNPRLIIVCGLPGSGKTTLAKKLERDLNAIRFCPDDWMEALKIDIWDEERRAKLEAFQWKLGQQLLSLGQTIIIEWGTWAKSERDELRKGARALGASVELHYLSASVDVLFKRIQKRAMEDPPITREQVEHWAENIQVPTAEEMAEYDEPSNLNP